MMSITTLPTQWRNYNFLTPKKEISKVSQCHMINRILHSCPCIIEFIKLVAREIKCSVSLAFYLFSSTRLLNLIKHEHSCEIIYLKGTKHETFAILCSFLILHIWNFDSYKRVYWLNYICSSKLNCLPSKPNQNRPLPAFSMMIYVVFVSTTAMPSILLSAQVKTRISSPSVIVMLCPSQLPLL